LHFGVLVIMTYIFQKFMLRILPLIPGLYRHPSMPIPQGVHEIREHGFAFALLASSILYLWRASTAESVENLNVPQEALPAAESIVPVGIEKKGQKI
jgi:hypothetical protein